MTRLPTGPRRWPFRYLPPLVERAIGFHHQRDPTGEPRGPLRVVTATPRVITEIPLGDHGDSPRSKRPLPLIARIATLRGAQSQARTSRGVNPLREFGLTLPQQNGSRPVTPIPSSVLPSYLELKSPGGAINQSNKTIEAEWGNSLKQYD